MASCTTTGEGSSGLSYSTKQTIAKSKFDTTRSVKFDQTKNQKHCKFKGADPTMETSCKRLRLKSGSKSSLICIMFFVTTSTWCLRLEKKNSSLRRHCSLAAHQHPVAKEWENEMVPSFLIAIAELQQKNNTPVPINGPSSLNNSTYPILSHHCHNESVA